MLGQLIQHWHITGNDTYNGLITQALQHQVGPDKNYMPPNQSNSLVDLSERSRQQYGILT